MLFSPSLLTGSSHCKDVAHTRVLSHWTADVRRLLYIWLLVIVILAGCLHQAALLDPYTTLSTVSALALVFIVALALLSRVLPANTLLSAPGASDSCNSATSDSSLVASSNASASAASRSAAHSGHGTSGVALASSSSPRRSLRHSGARLSTPLVLHGDFDECHGALDLEASPPSSLPGSPLRAEDAARPMVHTPTATQQLLPPCWTSHITPASPSAASALASLDDSSGSGESGSDLDSARRPREALAQKRQGLANPQDDGELSDSDDEEVAEFLYQRISPDDLASKLANKSVQVIDVRGRDFKGGHIPGCVNMRTSSILECPGAVIDICSEAQGVQQIVFTCMYSKLRAPRCATAVARLLQQQCAPGDGPRVLVLQGGMQGWVNHWYRTQSRNGFNKHVVEFDSEIWQFCENVGRREGKLFTHNLVHSMDAVWSKGGQKELALALEDALHDRARLCRVPQELNDPAVHDFSPKDRHREWKRSRS